jgi:hypothetical protein
LTDALTASQIVEIDNYLTAFLPTNALRTITTFTATAGQTTFSVTYTQGLIDVFYNGSCLAQSEYTAINGTSIILATACQVNDIVVVYAYSYSVGAYSGIGGSGTTNYVPKFTSSNVLGNSQVYDSGTYVGINNTTPLAMLDVYIGSVGTYFRGGSDNVARQLKISSSTTTNAGDTHTIDAQSGTGNLVFATTSTERMRINASGAINIKDGTLTGGGGFEFTSEAFFGARFQSNAYKFMAGNNSTEYMRIESARVLIGQSTASISTNGWNLQTDGGGHASFAISNNEAFIYNNRNTGTTYEIDFRTNSIERGKISVTDSGVSYVTTSDYRVKEDFKDFNGLDKVSAIKVYDFKFKDMDLRTDGVIAHELQEVLPYAVTGEKDGRKFQGVDYSKIVPVLVKAIQELKQELDELKQK